MGIYPRLIVHFFEKIVQKERKKRKKKREKGRKKRDQNSTFFITSPVLSIIHRRRVRMIKR